MPISDQRRGGEGVELRAGTGVPAGGGKLVGEEEAPKG